MSSARTYHSEPHPLRSIPVRLKLRKKSTAVKASKARPKIELLLVIGAADASTTLGYSLFRNVSSIDKSDPYRFLARVQTK
jgi:hypothetical protein